MVPEAEFQYDDRLTGGWIYTHNPSYCGIDSECAERSNGI